MDLHDGFRDPDRAPASELVRFLQRSELPAQTVA
jgi:hypothetical protein